MPPTFPEILPAAVLFDMDGTLTEPLLDFARIRSDMGIGPGSILASLAQMSDPDRMAAEAILLRHEDEAAARSTLNSGCRELLATLSARGVLVGCITLNSRVSAKTVFERHRLPIEVIVTREDTPPKPSPEPLRLACRRLGVAEADTWMVGDGRYDIEAGTAAAMRTIWLSHGRPCGFEAVPWREVRDLWELSRMLKEFE
ncbi:MAG TPA: HAD family hydrolase [Tepidisphaeraceae bacterium]|jgi:HAD superfamily hydrolase (TIGR01549 family)|nr:HAD family hydrolase [Tepidisphaeraceae bacterium]